jgi:hypothetical protein
MEDRKWKMEEPAMPSAKQTAAAGIDLLCVHKRDQSLSSILHPPSSIFYLLSPLSSLLSPPSFPPYALFQA